MVEICQVNSAHCQLSHLLWNKGIINVCFKGNNVKHCSKKRYNVKQFKNNNFALKKLCDF